VYTQKSKETYGGGRKLFEDPFLAKIKFIDNATLEASKDLKAMDLMSKRNTLLDSKSKVERALYEDDGAEPLPTVAKRKREQVKIPAAYYLKT